MLQPISQPVTFPKLKLTLISQSISEPTLFPLDTPPPLEVTTVLEYLSS